VAKLIDFAYIGINPPTARQYKIAAKSGVNMAYVGFAGATDGRVTHEDLIKRGEFRGIVTSSVSTALRLLELYQIGTFERDDKGREVLIIHDLRPPF
jgi:hypothetical protein